MRRTCSTNTSYPRPYPPQRIALHWLSAAIILWALVSGFFAVSRATTDPLRSEIDLINPQLTTLFIPFFVWRGTLYLRTHPWREWSGGHFSKRITALGHAALYAAIMLVLVTGYIMMPRPWRLLGVLPMPWLPHGAAAHAEFNTIHGLLSLGLGVLVGGHILAVILHHLQGRPILWKMAFPRIWRRPG